MMLANEDKVILSHFLDKAALCSRKNIPTATKFLTLVQQTQAQELAKSERLSNVGFYGVGAEAERKIAVFYPPYMDFEQCCAPFLTLIRCTKSPQDTLTHRDYLGSILGLGIERDVVGDIFIHETGADIVVLRDIAPYLMSNYRQAGRKKLTLCEIPPSELHTAIDSGVSVREPLSSLRFDCAVSALWKLSRTQSEEVIAAGRVLLNDAECKKPDRLLKVGDKLNWRGKGKCVFTELLGQSKKGKIVTIFTKYC